MSAIESRGKCPECDEENVVGERVSGKLRCPVCGSELIVLEARLPQEADFDEAFGFFRTHKRAGKVMIAKLRRIKPDLRTNILEPQVQVSVSGIHGECIGIPATFGTLDSLIDRPIRMVVPSTANVPKLNDLKGCVAVIFRGGGVSFAYKALVCAAAGAVGVIIIQTFDVWPFTPSDYSGEIDKAGGLNIPVIALSSSTGKRLAEHLDNAAKDDLATGARIRVTLSLKKDDSDYVCAICHDDLAQKEAEKTILQMPCLHFFHEECILPWLENNHTCPNCRYQLPTEDGTVGEARDVNDGGVSLGWFS